MTTNITTRRALLRAATTATAYAAGAAIVAGGAIVATEVRAETQSRGVWDQAYAAWSVAKRKSDRIGAAYDRVFSAWKASAPDSDALDLGAISYRHREEILRSLDLDAFEATFRAGKLPSLRGTTEEALTAIASVREYRQQVKANDARHRMDEWDDAVDKHVGPLAEAENRLMATPAPDAAALLWKINHIFDDGDNDDHMAGWSLSFIEPIRADVQRFANGGS